MACRAGCCSNLGANCQHRELMQCHLSRAVMVRQWSSHSRSTASNAIHKSSAQTLADLNSRQVAHPNMRIKAMLAGSGSAALHVCISGPNALNVGKAYHVTSVAAAQNWTRTSSCYHSLWFRQKSLSTFAGNSAWNCSELLSWMTGDGTWSNDMSYTILPTIPQKQSTKNSIRMYWQVFVPLTLKFSSAGLSDFCH